MTRARTSAALAASVQHEHRLAFNRKSCAAETCGERVRPGRVFCRNHWYFLPAWLRRSIINTFRDAEWEAHQNAIRQAADFIDREQLEARERGCSEIVSAHEGEKIVRYIGRNIA